MLEIAEFISPTPTPVWKLAKTGGRRSRGRRPAAATTLPQGDAPWDFGPLAAH